MLIDAHQHYWTPARGDYDWMPKGDAVLDRQYMPSELEPQLAAAGIDQHRAAERVLVPELRQKRVVDDAARIVRQG